MTGAAGQRAAYGQLTRFLVPLILTQLIAEFGSQVLNGGMARVPRPTHTLAAFGLAWGLVGLVTNALSYFRGVALVLVDSQRAGRTVLWVALSCGAAMSLVLAALSFSTTAIDDLHGISSELGASVRLALIWLAPTALLEGLNRFLSGLLLRVHRPAVLTVATGAHVFAAVTAVLLFLPTDLVRAEPIALPVVATYAGALVELAALGWGYRRFAARELERTRAGAEPEASSLGVTAVLRFFWPLALVMAFQGLSRPLINLFVARGEGGEAALAALGIVYHLAFLVYVWLNDMRSLVPAFVRRQKDLRPVGRFMAGCGAISLAAMLILFWTPLRELILLQLLALEPALVADCREPLLWCVLFPPLVTVRAYFHGLSLRCHQTRALAPSAPCRVGAILVALLVLPEAGFSGATLGLVSLLAGFAAEAVATWWYGRGPIVDDTIPNDEVEDEDHGRSLDRAGRS